MTGHERKTAYRHERQTASGSSAGFYPVCRKTPCFSYGDIRHFHRIYASN